MNTRRKRRCYRNRSTNCAGKKGYLRNSWQNRSAYPGRPSPNGRADLEKLQALSRFFRVSLDVLVGQSDTDEPPAPVPQAPPPAHPAPPSSHAKPGLYLCLLGALLLLVSGILSLVFPQGMETVNQSSTVTLNGTGILWLLCGVLMAVGVALLLRKK